MRLIRIHPEPGFHNRQVLRGYFDIGEYPCTHRYWYFTLGDSVVNLPYDAKIDGILVSISLYHHVIHVNQVRIKTCFTIA
jgi:hypothetical protein